VIAEVYGPLVADAAPRLQGMVAIGLERTIDQDPGFALRVMVDIAARALSPAINDPTTAVQVLARVGDLLQRILGCAGEVAEHRRSGIFVDETTIWS
jgi:uncharacterized membrane protein